MVSRRSTLRSVGPLLAAVGAGCLGSAGPDADRIRWRKSVRGAPALAGDDLYVLDRLTVVALSSADGTERWTVGYDEDQFDRRLCLRDDIVVDAGRLYVPACDGLRALGRSDGARAWSVDAPLRSAAAVESGRVYVKSDALLAIDAETGSIDWRAPVGGERLTSPATTPDAVVVVDRPEGAVIAFDADGDRRWTHRTDAETRSPAVRDGTVYVATAPDPGRAGRLLALDLADGTVQWAVDTPSPRRGTRPVVGERSVYLGCTGRDHGTLVARRRRDGAEEWRFADQNSGVYEPVLADDRVYAGSNDDTLYAFSRSGDLQWRIETGSTVGSVAVGPDHVYASNNERLFAVARD
jgi:outer membrane protein assembly factor BamB